MNISMDVPEQYLLDESAEQLARKIRLYAALLMFRAGEISAGAAAELADVDRVTFAEECARHLIPVTDYPPEDLRKELSALRRAS